MAFEENIKIEEIDKLIGEKFGNYSKYIIQERALPDLRDGLKPVQRRILFAMNKLSLYYRTPHKKSARVVGDVIGKYHPHGDSSVYEAMVRMSQLWKMNLPLVDMHGNNGSIDGDSPAAMRYTESRLSKLSNYLLLNIEKEIVPFVLNFDDTEKEPVVLPALFPNLLLNGSTGIASGYSTNIPPHNLHELINALIFVFRNKGNKLSYSSLKKIIKGPDFPTGGIINGREGIDEIYRTGKGKINLRARYEINKNENEIYIIEIPFETSKSEIVKEISKIIDENKLPGILDVRDDSGRHGLKITILLSSDANFGLILNYLFKYTSLEKPFHANLIAIQNKKPVLLTLKDTLENFANFQIKTYLSLFDFELKKYQKRLEIVDALILLNKSVNLGIKLIQEAKNKEEAKEKLIEFYNFNNNQAEAIVNLRLYRLTSTDVNNLYEDFKFLKEKIAFYDKGLNDKSFLIENIIGNLEILNNKFLHKRKTKILSKKLEEEIKEIDLISEKNIIFGVTFEGYIKVIDKSLNQNYKEEDYKLVNGDFLIFTKEVSNLKKIFIFTTTGKYFVLPIYKFNEQKWTDLGEHLSKYFSIDSKDHVLTCGFFDDVKEIEEQILISTKKGKIKKMNISEFENQTTKRGLKFISLLDVNDAVVSINSISNENQYVSSVSKKGYYIKYNLKGIPLFGSNSMGITNMKLNPDDYVVGTVVVEKDKDIYNAAQVLFVSKYARAKRVRFSDLKITSRARKGSRILNKLNKYENDEIISYVEINKNKNIYLMFKDNKIENFLTNRIIAISNIDSNFNWIYTNNKIIKNFAGIELKFSENLNLDRNNIETEESEETEETLNLDKIFDDLKDLD
ncbi:MAG: DNA topoisomerase 4 subunit A [Candidatus Hepatoplasma vulgare]|nr:MAG: DNA topoisomerase 4 subunit A [Candidatus Hepatoplasma sp.]